MKKYSLIILAIIVLFIIFSGNNRALATTEAKTFAPSADAWIERANPNTPHPTGNITSANSFSPDQTAYGLIKFDISTIPAGATIDSATMTLAVSACSPQDQYSRTLTAKRMTRVWTEDTATWSQLNLYTSSAGAAVADQSLCSIESPSNFNLKDIVQAWVSGTSNYGIAILPDTASVFSRSYFSKDVSGEQHQLTVGYSYTPASVSTPPTGGTAGSASTGSFGSSTQPSSSSSSSSSSTTSGNKSAGTTSNGGSTSTDSGSTTQVSNNPTINSTGNDTADKSVSIIEAIKHPSKIFESDWPWWKKALMILIPILIVGVIIAGIFLLVRRNRKKVALPVVPPVTPAKPEVPQPGSGSPVK